MSPSHRLITGPRAALERALADAVHDAKAGDPFAAVTVLVGETLLRPYLRRRLAELLGGHVNVELVTPGELAMHLGRSALEAAGRRPMPPFLERALVRSATEAVPAIPSYEGIAKTRGFQDAVLRTVRELRGAGIPADGTPAGDSDGALDLAFLYRTIEAHRVPYFTTDDALAAADPARLHGDGLIVYALWTPTVRQRRLLSRLAESVPVTVLLPAASGAADAATSVMRAWASSVDATATCVTGDPPRTNAAFVAAEAVRRMTAETSGDEPWLPFDPERPAAAGGPDPSGEGDHDPLGDGARPVPGEASAPSDDGARAVPGTATDSTSAPPFAPSRADDTVTVIEAPDPAREVDEVVRTVLHWAADDIPFHEIAIAYRHAEPYRSLLESSLREAGVPVYLHAAPTVAERPLGRRVEALLRLLERGLQRADLSAFLTDSRLPEDTFDAYGRTPAAAWDAISRDAGIVGGIDQWRERLAAYRQDLEERLGDASEAAYDRRARRLERATHLGRFVDDLQVLAARRPEAAPWADHVVFLREALTRYVVGAEVVLAALAEVTVPSADLTKDGADRVVADVLGRLRAPDAEAGSFARRGVIVADALSLRHVGVRAIAIVGLADGRFPSAPAEDPLFRDADRVEANRRNGWELPLRAGAADPEPLQFAGLLQAGADRLAVSYARTEGSPDRPSLPSTFIRGVVDTLTDRHTEIEKFADAAEPWLRRVGAAQVGAMAAAEARTRDEWLVTALEGRGATSGAGPRGDGDPDDEAAARAAEEARVAAVGLLARERPGYVRAVAADAARTSGVLTPYDGTLSDDVLEILRGLPRLQRPVSPSTLEDHATCPHRTLLKGVLGLEPREEPERVLRLDARNTGTVLHAVLERFLVERGPRGARDAARDVLEQRLHELLDEELAAMSAQGLTGYPVLLELDRRAMRRDLAVWLQGEVEEDARAVAAFERLPAPAGNAEDAEALRPQPLLERGQEVSFGLPLTPEELADPNRLSTDEPLPLPGDGPKVLVHGRIDRVRATADGRAFRVVDYKTGKPKAEPDDIAFGRALQLPIYVWAAARALGVDPARGAAEYDHFRRPAKERRVPFHGAALTEHRDDIVGVIETLAQGIHDGDFHREPTAFHGRNKSGETAARSNCGWCDFDALCHPQRDAMRQAKATDPRARFWEDQRAEEGDA